MGLAAPWYVHPVETAQWDWLRTAPIGLAVINVENGPGPARDGQYVEALRTDFAPTLAGYVDVGYGRRSFSDVMNDVARWIAWYNISRIFLDQVPTQSRQFVWSVDWISALRSSGVQFVAVNPGTPPHNDILEAADLICVCEVGWKQYQTLVMPERLLQHSATKQWHLVHSVPWWASLDISKQAQNRGAIWSWATHATFPNPWNAGREGR